MGFEKNLLDRIINGSLLGKRQIGRPLKWNIVNKHGRGVLELMYKPRNQLEQVIGKTIHGFLPMISYFTYKFHVERARVAGMRVEDSYYQKFFREPFIAWHIYAQNFHPYTLNERIRNVTFYRKPKTLFKGFKVPDWAHSHKSEGWDVDAYSRAAWDSAWKEFNSEWTPMPFTGHRVEPNLINVFRFEHVGKGYSSRYFYNEVPNPQWHRHGGHLDDKEKTLYSFKYGDQEHEDVLGFDLSTEEGRKEYAAEVKRWTAMTPEIAESFGVTESTDGKTNHAYISTEPHFQRVLTHYRAYAVEQAINKAVSEGRLSQNDVKASKHFFDKGIPSASLLVMGNKGHLGDDDGFAAFKRVLDAAGLGKFEFKSNTPEPAEEQFQAYLDRAYNVTQAKLNKALPFIIADSRDRTRIQAILESGENALPQEQSRHLA